MSTLEDKILGEKREYYCSSSESEHEDDGDSGDDEVGKTVDVADTGPPPVNPPERGCSTNTGPKGVIKDWQQYKQIQVEQRAERERERLALIKKLSLTCRSELNAENEEEDPELADLLEDPFILEYSKRKMEEMMDRSNRAPRFGVVVPLATGQEFLDAVDKENKTVTVIVHIYEEKVADCRRVNECLEELCVQYPEVKFCKLQASNAGVSRHFKVSGVPALLVYKNGTLVGNFVRITEELGNEFCANDIENFLLENGILIDRTFVPTIIRQSQPTNLDDEID